LFVIAPNGLDELKRLLQRYPDIAGALPAVLCGDPSNADDRTKNLRKIFIPFFQAVQERTARMLETADATSVLRLPPYPNAVRFFYAGHNYLQEASVRALRHGIRRGTFAVEESSLPFRTLHGLDDLECGRIPSI
jgi:hypothetical protein